MFPWNLVRIDVRGSTCSGLDHKQIGGKFFSLPKRLTSLGFFMACGRWWHVSATSANPRSSKTNGHANNCSSGRIWYKMCNIRIDGASGICVGANFRRLVSTKDWNTSNRTDLPLRPEATKLEIRLRTLEKRQELYRPPLVALPFPLLILCLNVVPLRLPTGRSARKAPTLRHVCDEVDEKTETKWSSSSTTKLIPRLNSTPLLSQTVKRSKRLVWSSAKTWPCVFVCFFGTTFRQLRYHLGNFDLVKPYISGGEKKENNTEVRYRDGHAEHVCMCAKIPRSTSQKHRGHLDLCAENMCILRTVVIWNFLVVV